MAADAPRRTLHHALDQTIGKEAAAILMDHLPAGGAASLATKDDLERVFHDLVTRMEEGFAQNDLRFAQIDGQFADVNGRFAQIDAHFAQIDGHFAQIDGHFAQIDGHFAQIDERFKRLEERMDAGFALSTERMERRIESVRADIRGELVAVVHAQTRTILVGLIGTVVSLVALAYALSSLAPPP